MKKNDGFYRVYAHGVCPGDDEPMGIGAAVLSPEGQVIRRVSRWGHPGTKTRAEYLAVIIGLEQARAADVQDIEIRTDSELVVRHLNGEFQSDDFDLTFSHGEAVSELESFKHRRCRHIPEEENGLAIRLTDRALDTKERAAESASNRVETDRDHVDEARGAE
jgi:ribonuclease HI